MVALLGGACGARWGATMGERDWAVERRRWWHPPRRHEQEERGESERMGGSGEQQQRIQKTFASACESGGEVRAWPPHHDMLLCVVGHSRLISNQWTPIQTRCPRLTEQLCSITTLKLWHFRENCSTQTCRATRILQLWFKAHDLVWPRLGVTSC
jgi:hypothetical protein